MKLSVGLIAVSCFCICRLSFSQALPHFAHVSTHARIERIENSSMWLYSYDVTNDVGNSGTIRRFLIDISRHPNSFSPDTFSLPFADSFRELSFRLMYPFVVSKIVPVGFPILPAHWDASITVSLAARFSADTLRPEAGQGVGLQMVSKWLPTIRKFTVVPVFDVGAYFPSMEDSNAVPIRVIDSIRNAINYNGWTLGPASIDSPFVALNFLDTIKSYITESRTLDWITSDQIKNKYTWLIDSAKANLAATPTRHGVAKSKLDSVLVNVYPDSSAGLITSEAYALLRFNTEYVLKNLREEDSTYALQNTSSSFNATATNSARHLAKWEGYLHEVFTSSGEIIYRRSTNSGSSWDQTHLINTTLGDNSRPCLTVTQHGVLHIVWQRRVAPSGYQLWHSSSGNDGTSWSSPAIVAASVATSQYQPGGIMPVVMEEEKSGVLMLAYASQSGLVYQTSDDDGASWQTPATLSGQYNDRVQSPSLAKSNSYLSLVYAYQNDEESPWSRIYDGTWSDEESVGKGTDISDAASPSVAIDLDGNPLAAWSGYSPNMTYGKVIAFRSGYGDNAWSEWFTMFGENIINRLNPSLTYYNRNDDYGIAIVGHTSNNAIKLITLTNLTPPSWDITTLSQSGLWGSITQETSTSGTPLHCWTDQSSSPYQIVVGSSGALSPKATSESLIQKRRGVIQHRTLHTGLALEMEMMKIVSTNGDTITVPFKQSALRQRGKINHANMWEYLGTGVITVPANARQLIVTKRFGERGVPGQRKFSLRVLNNRGISIAVLDTTATDGTVAVNIAPYAGMSVTFTPGLSVPGIENTLLDIGVGDVYIKSR